MLDLITTGYPITSLYAGLLGLLLVVLSVGVVRARLEHEVSMGDGGVSDLHVAQRRHGNFVEYVPYAIVLLVLLEASNTSAWMLHTLGAALVCARILHPFGLASEFGLRFPRMIGSLVTWIVIAWASCVLIYGTGRPPLS